MKCARNTLGVPPGTGNMAVLVRLGWLPLDYYLACRACVWYLKVIKGEAGCAVKEFAWRTYANDENWANTCLLKPAFHLLTRLSISSGIDLFNVSPKLRFIEIKNAMFSELTNIWNKSHLSRWTYHLHHIWDHNNSKRSVVSKKSITLYHKYALGRAPTNAYEFSIGRVGSPLCRHGCGVREDEAHIFFHCPALKKTRFKLKKKCHEIKLTFKFKNLLTCPKLQNECESFLIISHI